ncbi:MAG TPA: Gfo/Idh/MocA family oxidoreductase [Acidobacteriota bacterium]|jgi:predicted dehydrogenase
MEHIRIGIIGAGWVVRARHLPAFKNLHGTDVRLIWSRNPDRAKEVATEFGIPKTPDRWEEIVESPEVDAVVIAAPPVLHLPATLAALRAGKHVLCQARMARNLKEAQEMLRAAQTYNLVTALYPARPGLKGDKVMRRLLHDEKFVGEIRELRVTGMELAEKKQGYDWGADPDVFGVNAMTLGMWSEVSNRWVGLATRVVALGKTHVKQRTTRNGESAEAVIPDSLAVAAELECGATASYHFSACAASAPGHSIEIYGSRGALAYQLFVEEIRGASGSEKLGPIPIPPEEERAQSTDAEFIQSIRDGTPVSPSFEEGLRYMEFCEAVALSAKTGTAVTVPPPQPKMHSWGRFLN